MIEKFKDLIPGYIPGTTCSEYDYNEYSFVYKKIDEVIDIVNQQTKTLKPLIDTMNRMTDCIERNHKIIKMQDTIIRTMEERANNMSNMLGILGDEVFKTNITSQSNDK